MKMKRLTILLLFFSQITVAQEKSKLTFIPEFHKDTIDLVNIDSLKYDINIVYDKEEIATIYFTGKIGFVNKVPFNFNNDITGFAASSIVFTIYFPDERGVPAINSTNKINYADYKIRLSNYHRLFNEKLDPKYSPEAVIDLINKMNIRFPTFFMGNRQLVYNERGANRHLTEMRLSLKVVLSKNDIRYINIRNTKEEVISKINYLDLLKKSLSQQFSQVGQLYPF